MSTDTASFRSRSRTLPARVKIEQKIGQDKIPRPRSPMRRLADILKRKKKRGKGDVDSIIKLPLERQAWFHGKITADFSERYLRRDGHFLVREDPAKPGSCFIVVRHRRESIHVPLCKVNSSKGTRIKFRTEGSENSFDSIPELINYYVSEKKPLSPKTQAVIAHAVSRDATLLSTDDRDFHSRYVFNASPSNACPPKPPGTGPLRQKKLDKYARKNSDPGLHLTVNNCNNLLYEFDKQNGLHVASGEIRLAVQSKQGQKIPEPFLEKTSKEDNTSDRFYETPLGENETESDKETPEDAYHYYEKPDLKVDSDNFYDRPREPKTATTKGSREENCVNGSEESFCVKPDETNVGERFYNEPSLESHTQETCDSPPSTGNQKSLSNQSNDGPIESLEDVYDKPRASMEMLYDSPKGSEDNLYDKPPPRPKRVVSFRNSDPILSDKEVLPRPRLVTRSSAPSSPSCTGGGLAAVLSKTETEVIPNKNHSGSDLMATQQGLSSEGNNNTFDKPTEAESKLRHTAPPKKPQRPSLSRSRSEQSSHSKQDVYDSPRSRSVSGDDRAFKSDETAARLQPESPKPLDKKGIFLSVMKKISEKLLTPFLESDCLSLARHITRVDLVLLWDEKPDRCSWSIEDGTGGAKGLEILTLPQGREKRFDLLQRFANLSHWVATLVVAAGDLDTREKVLSKLIELADILSDKLGNLISFMAVMEGLALPQVTRLHHTWSCLHHRCCSTAILYHSTLKPLAGLLSSGAPSPFPGVCLPYIVPLVRYVEMTPDEILHDWAHSEVDLGLEVILAHLASGRALTQQLEEFRQEAVSRLYTKDYKVNAQLVDYFEEKVNVGNVLGLGADPSNRATKLKTLLQWLSENAENSTLSSTGV